MPERLPLVLRQAVEQRASSCCEYCHSPARYATQRFALEHILPRSQGGATHLDNLALACQGCNNHKYTKIQAHDPVTKRLVALFHPRRQRWQDHFTWDARFAIVLGLTAVGRATVEALQLNRPELQNLRRLLYAAGEHPRASADEGQD
jgi:hypothetical protein